MLSLSIGGQVVELPPDFSLTMNLKSPIFSEVGSYSYPFKLPYSPRNAIAMGFRHKVASTGDPFKVDQGVFRWNRSQLFAGSVNMKILNSGTFEGNIFEGNGDFNYLRKNYTLQDVDYGELTFASESARLNYMNGCMNTAYPERDICFPKILNKTYFEELPANTGLHYFNNYILSLLKSESIGGITERYIIVPMLYLRFVLKKIFEQQNYSFDDSFFTLDHDFDSLALFNTVDCNEGEHGYFLYPPDKLLLNYHIPRMSINDFFTGLETFFNIRFFINNINRSVHLMSVDSIIKSPECIEFSDRMISVSVEPGDQITGYTMTMNIQTDDEVYAFKKELDDERLSHLKTTVATIKDLKAWPVDDILDLRFVEEKNMYYILFTDKLWRPWDETVDFHLIYRYRNDDQSIESKFSTLLNYNIGDASVIGSAKTDWKDVSGKLFFAHYDETTPDWKKMIALPLTENNSLYFGGENGIFNKHYKAYFDFRMSTKLVKIVKQMEFSELKDFDFSKKYMINGIKYLIAGIQVTIKKDRITAATLDCYPCP